MRIAWHLGGVSWKEYLSMSIRDRFDMVHALGDMIDDANRTGAPAPHQS